MSLAREKYSHDFELKLKNLTQLMLTFFSIPHIFSSRTYGGQPTLLTYLHPLAEVEIPSPSSTTRCRLLQDPSRGFCLNNPGPLPRAFALIPSRSALSLSPAGRHAPCMHVVTDSCVDYYSWRMNALNPPPPPFMPTFEETAHSACSACCDHRPEATSRPLLLDFTPDG